MQAEDELASIGMVIGAAWNGARAFTATSGPGISLMQEFLGLRLLRRDPGRVFDVQRAGPSTGMPTRTQQCDIMACAYASHGDTKHVLLIPEDPAECFDFAADAFDLADRLQTPVFVMIDLDIGMNDWLCRPLTWDDKRQIRPRQGDDGGRPRGRRRTSAATSTSTATASPIAPIPARTRRKGAYLHPRHLARPLRPLHRSRARPMSRTCSGCCASSTPPRSSCRNRCARTPPSRTRYGVIYYGSTSPGDGRGARCAGGRRPSISTRCASAPSRSTTTCASFIADHDCVFVVEQNRDAQMRIADRQRVRHRSGAAGPDPALRRHADHRPLHRRRDRATGSRLNVTPLRKVASSMTYLDQAEVPSPDAADQRARLHAARLRRRRSRRCAPAAATTRSAPRSSRPASSCRSRRTASPRCPASAARRRRRPTSSAKSHGFNSRARPHAVGADRRQPRQPRPDLSRRLRRRRLAPRSGFGQFAHAIRRGVNMVYIVENNGVYGLTKGQFSATADNGSKSKKGAVNTDSADRPRRHGAAARRDLRRAQLLRRQGAAGAADQGRDPAPAAPPSST